MSEVNEPLWKDILISQLLDDLYLTPPHHGDFDSEETADGRNYIAQVRDMLDRMKSKAKLDNIKNWINHLSEKLQDLEESKLPEQLNRKKDFLLMLNYLCNDQPDSNYKKKFSEELFRYAIHTRYDSTNSFFKILVVDDYFIFSVPIIIEAVRNLTGKNSGMPLLHFEFECLPEEIKRRCQEEKYDLILLDIDFGLLDKVNGDGKIERQALKVANFASKQDPQIPIVVFSKYEDVHYYEGLLSNVIGKLLKEDIRNKVREKTLNKKEIVMDNFISPLIGYLLDYYKVRGFKYKNTLIIGSLPDSSILRMGVYEYSNIPKPNIIQLPDKVDNYNDNTLISILKKDQNNLYDYGIIPYIDENSKLNLFVLCRVPDCIEFSGSLYLKSIQDRLKHYGIKNQYRRAEIKILIHNEENFKYEVLLLEIDYNVNSNIKWDVTGKDKFVAMLGRDLRYFVVPVFSKMSLLDIVGPIMIGPSSSHTAGANRIGRLARNFAKTLINRGLEVKHIVVEMLNSFESTGEGHGSNRAIAAGLLGLQQFDLLLPIVLDEPSKNGNNQIKSKDEIDKNKSIPGVSDKKGHIKISDKDIKVSFDWIRARDTSVHNNSVRIKFEINNNSEFKAFEMTARSYGGGNVQISSIKSTGNGTEEYIPLRVKIFADKNFQPFDFSDEELDRMKDKLNGKENIEIEGIGLLSKIYEEPQEEITKAIKQINNRFKFELKYVNILGTINAKPPSFININDLIKEEELWKTALEYEMWYLQEFYKNSGSNNDSKLLTAEQVFNIFRSYYFLMKTIAKKSVIRNLKSNTEYKSNYGNELYKEMKNEKNLGKIAMVHAIGVNEINAKMILPVLAAPTAGSCGVIPGVLIALEHYLKAKKFSRQKIEVLLTKGLLVASLIGLVITNIVPPAGATHGCQAEIGTAGAMASAMATFVIMTQKGKKDLKKINEAIVHSAALSLDNSLGLICDPIGGRVEYPCIQRAGDKAAESINIAFKAINGIRGKISPSDIVWVMKKVGEDMLPIYRETSRGPYANSPSSI